jgi:hypothetical protein
MMRVYRYTYESLKFENLRAADEDPSTHTRYRRTYEFRLDVTTFDLPSVAPYKSTGDQVGSNLTSMFWNSHELYFASIHVLLIHNY